MLFTTCFNMVTETIREASALTADYVASSAFNMQYARKLCLELHFTKGSSSGFMLRIEKSNTGDIFCQECTYSQMDGVTYYIPNERKFSLANDATLYIEIPMACKQVRVSAKAIGSAAGTSLKIVASRLDRIRVLELGNIWLLTPSQSRKFEYMQKSNLRNPTCSVLISDFGDISDYCLYISCTSEIEDTLHQPNYGRGNIVIADTEDIFIENGRSKIEPMSHIKIFAGFDNINIPIWTGTIADSSVDSDNRQLNLSLAQFGELLNRSSTSGSFASYNTPKKLIEYLCSFVGIPAPIFENADGQPSIVSFGNTYQDNNRTLWAMVHGACLNIFYIPFFDTNGILNLRRRESFNKTNFVFDDDNIISLKWAKNAELINNKIVDYGECVKFEFALGDQVRFGQTTRSSSNTHSIAKYGEHSDYETDPFIGTWTNAGRIIDEILDYYAYRRYIYELTSPGIPQLKLLDMVYVVSEKFNIKGDFVIIGRTHNISKGSYTTTDTILSMEEML